MHAPTGWCLWAMAWWWLQRLFDGADDIGRSWRVHGSLVPIPHSICVCMCDHLSVANQKQQCSR